MINIKVKLVTDTAIMPTKAHDTDACFDLYADMGNGNDYVIEPHKTVKIPTGISTEIPNGYFAPVFARSGLGIKQNLRLSNCTGIIDSDYRGEWVVALTNDCEETRMIHYGDRIAQFTIQEVLPVTLEKVDTLSDTERGVGGFGSSGK